MLVIAIRWKLNDQTGYTVWLLLEHFDLLQRSILNANCTIHHELSVGINSTVTRSVLWWKLWHIIFFDLEWIRLKMKSASVRLENGLQTKRCFNYTHSTQHIQWNPFNCCNFTMLIYIPLAFSNPLINKNYNSHLLIREKKQKKKQC